MKALRTLALLMLLSVAACTPEEVEEQASQAETSPEMIIQTQDAQTSAQMLPPPDTSAFYTYEGTNFITNLYAHANEDAHSNTACPNG